MSCEALFFPHPLHNHELNEDIISTFYVKYPRRLNEGVRYPKFKEHSVFVSPQQCTIKTRRAYRRAEEDHDVSGPVVGKLVLGGFNCLLNLSRLTPKQAL